jgi:undecaprenyl diphosphate synthase
MDGNGRWAKKRGMPRTYGHKKGAENVVNITRAMKDSGIKYLTLYAFSTENWQRSEDEVQALMQLLNDYLDNEFQEIMENDVKIVFIGERNMLSSIIQQKIQFVEEKSKNNKSLTLCIALSYGSRQEILATVKKISKLVKNGDMSELFNTIGKENFEALNKLFHVFYESFPGMSFYNAVESINKGEETEETKKFYEIVAKRNEILKSMEEHSQNKSHTL